VAVGIAAIRAEALGFVYPGGHRALADISFAVEIGEAFAVIGPNGSGKSTLLHLLIGLLAGSGRATVMGEEVRRSNLARIRARVGLVFQDPDDQLFMPRVLDDVMFGPLNHGYTAGTASEKGRAALAAMGMAGLEERESGRLSLGEKKRAALASILVLDPDILLLDEPTAGLDPGGRRRLLEVLKDCPHTRIVATHDLDLVWDLCPRLLILDRGRMVAGGESRLLLNDPELLEAHSLEVPLSARLD